MRFSAFLRGILRGQRPCPIWIRTAALRRFLQHPGQVAAEIKVILFCRLNQTKQNRAALGSVCGVGKQEVLSRDHKRLNVALGAVIAEFNATVLQK